MYANGLLTKDNCLQDLEIDPTCFERIPCRIMDQEMCDRAVELDPENLECVPEKFKHREMCENALMKCPMIFQYVPEKYITRDLVLISKRETNICRKNIKSNRYKNYRFTIILVYTKNRQTYFFLCLEMSKIVIKTNYLKWKSG